MDACAAAPRAIYSERKNRRLLKRPKNAATALTIVKQVLPLRYQATSGLKTPSLGGAP